jgi:hypothetical protein
MPALLLPLIPKRLRWRRVLWSCIGLAALASQCLADTSALTSSEARAGKVLSDDDKIVVLQSDGPRGVSVLREDIEGVQMGPDVATAAGDQQPVAPAPSGQETFAPAAAAPGPQAPQAVLPSVAEKKDRFRMWWDQYLRYEVYQPFTVPLPFSGERQIEEKIHVSGRAGLRLSLDAAGFSSNDRAQQIPGGTAVRTFRLYTDGQYGTGPYPTLYKLEFGTVSDSFDMTSGWLRWQGLRYVRNVQAGYETVPQILDNIYSSSALTFMEAPSMSLAFSPGSRLGVEADRTFLDKRMFASLGVFSIGSNPGLSGGTVTQTLVYPVVRVTGLPIYADRGKDDVTLLHLGFSAGYQAAKGQQFEFRARPESFIAPYLVDTGEVDADGASLLGLEAIESVLGRLPLG